MNTLRTLALLAGAGTGAALGLAAVSSGPAVAAAPEAPRPSAAPAVARVAAPAPVAPPLVAAVVGAPLPAPTETRTRPIDLAICLDTSGSMENLIESAKQHVWGIVNDLALARPQPELRVALLTFGNDGHDAEAGWVRVDTGLTADLDLVSERLFALSTDGGTELVGRVLRRAHDDLEWSTNLDALRLVVVAGNESADQDEAVRFADACAALAGRDILVNALYCGAESDDVATGWRQVAAGADGHYASIDTQGPPRVIETPFDERLAELSAGMNGTYLPWGERGIAGCNNQWAQDRNAAGLNGAAAASRALTKATANYNACSWDLVDAVAGDPEFDLAAIKPEDLPEAMREMTADERVAHVAKMAAERTALRAQVQELSTKRDAHVARVRAAETALGRETFESALLSAIRLQAGARGFAFAPATSQRVE